MPDGTDVMNDRRYLLAMMQRNPRDPLRQAAEKQWEYLNQQEAQQTNIAAHAANLAEQIQAREQAHGENVAQREARAKELADYRASVLGERKTEFDERQADRALAALQYLPTIYKDPKQVQAMSQQIMNQYLTRAGITAPAIPTDAATEAVRRFAGVAPTPAAPTPAPTGITQPTAAPVAVAGAPAPAAAPGAIPTEGPTGPTGVPPTQIERMIAATPAGMAYSASRGGYIPATTQGTIGGRPAGEVIAEGARRIGITPESASGLAALTAPPPGTLAAKPIGPTPAGPPLGAAGAGPEPPTPLNVRAGAAGEAIRGYTDPFTIVKNLFGGGGGGVNQLVKGGGGPTPEPTPGPTLPTPGPTLPTVAAAPQPTPVPTPPAQPTPGALPAPGQGGLSPEQQAAILEQARKRYAELQSQ